MMLCSLNIHTLSQIGYIFFKGEMAQVFIVTKPLESLVGIGNRLSDSLQHWGVVVNSSDISEELLFEAKRSGSKVKVKKSLFKNSKDFTRLRSFRWEEPSISIGNLLEIYSHVKSSFQDTIYNVYSNNCQNFADSLITKLARFWEKKVSKMPTNFQEKVHDNTIYRSSVLNS